MLEHAHDLRVEVQELPNGEQLVKDIQEDFRKAELSPKDRQMLEYAVKLTLHPSEMKREDVQALQDVGFSDSEIHDIAQITGLFNYYNRIADGLGIDLEKDLPQ